MGSLSFDVPPAWDEIGNVADRATTFLRAQELAPELVDAMTMSCCELLENAVKYGSAIDPIKVTMTIDPREVTVEVTNRVAGTDMTHLNRLDTMIQWIRGFQDPFQAYLERMKEVSSQSTGLHESGLGLVRVAYEGHAIIDFVIDHHDMLNVSAVRQR